MKSVLLTLILSFCAIASHAIDLTFSFSAPTCNGFTNGEAMVTATGGSEPYAYSWSNGQSGQTVLGVAAGTYSVTVTDQSGVTATGSVVVPEPAALVLTFSQSGPSCNGAYSPVTAQVSGGTPGYTYAWSTGQNTETIQPSMAGNVFVTVTDAAGCAVANTYFVPESSQIFTSYFAVAPKCAGGNDGSITPTIVGNNTPHSWVWSTGTSTNSNLTNVPTGNYDITITDQQGCTKTESILVPTQALVGVLPLMTNVLCHGTLSGTGTAIAFGGVNPYTLTWSTGSQDPIIQNLGAGNYTVTVVDGNGCSATAVGTVTEPDPLTNTVISVTPACGNNGSATVQPAGGTPPYNIVWNGGQFFGPTISGVPAGSYYVCTFDANNCQLDLVVEIPGSPGLNVNLVTQKATCVGVDDGVATAVVTGGSGNYTYAWSNGGPPVAQLNGLAAGLTLTVTVTDLTSGCIGTATASISTHHLLIAQITETDVLCANDPAGTATATVLTGLAPFTFNWDVNGTPASGPTITNLPAGAYPVTITDAQGCFVIKVANIDAGGSADALFTTGTVYCDTATVKLNLTDQSTSTGGAINSWQWVIAWETGSALFEVQNPPSIEVPAGSTGTIQLAITTEAGCTDLLLLPFEAGKQPVISINANTPLINCEGGPVPVNVIGDSSYVYTWSPMAGLTFINNNPQQVEANPASTTIYQVIAADGFCKDTLLVEVKRNVPFEVSLPNAAIESCDPTQQLTATLDVPNQGFDVDWFNAAGDSIATGISINVPAPDSLSSYTVVVTDQFGCSETATGSVIGIGVEVDAAILNLNEACENVQLQAGVINLDPNDVLTYSWSSVPPGLVFSDPNIANPTVSGPAGTYIISVVVTNQDSCTKTLTTPVTFKSSGTLVNLIDKDLCNGLVVGFDNNTNVPGTWTFGDGGTSTVNDPFHTYTNPGTYIFTFTPDDICYLPYSDTIQVNAEPAVVAEIEGDIASCFGLASFDFTDSTQAVTQIATWQWTFQPGNQTSSQQNPQVTFTGQADSVSAVLVVTDINGCKDTSDVLSLPVQIVNDSIAATASICPGGTLALNADSSLVNYTYVWTSNPPDPSLDTTAANPQVMPVGPTVYSVAISNGNCTVNQEVAVTIYEAANVQASADTVSCEDKPVSISATSTNANNFEWSRTRGFLEIFATGPIVSVLPVEYGMNYVRATTPQGCPAIDSVMVMYGGTDVAALQKTVYICNGGTDTLIIVNNNADDVLTYEWSGGLPSAGTQIVSPTAVSTYTVTVTNQFGCKDTLSFTATPTSLALNIAVTANDTIEPGQSVVLNANVTGGESYTYVWTPAETLNDPLIQSPIATPIDTLTTYTVVATDVPSGCTVQGDVLIVWLPPALCVDPFIFVPLAFSPNGDGNNDFFRVRGAELAGVELYFAVWNRWGEKLYETTELMHEGWDGKVQSTDSSPDAFAWYVRVVCGDGEVYERKGNVTLLR